MKKITAMEVSADGNTVYLAATEDNRDTRHATTNPEVPKIVAATFDKELRFISGIPLHHHQYVRINRLKRVKGEEILIGGCYKHFCVVEYVDKNLKEIGSIPNVHNGDIIDFELKDKTLYSRGMLESSIKVTTLGGLKKEVEPAVASIRSTDRDMYGAPTKPKEISQIPNSPKKASRAPSPNPSPTNASQIVNIPSPIVVAPSKYDKFEWYKIDTSFISPDSFEKIAVGPKGDRVYAGGKGLFIFEKDSMDETKFKALNYDGNSKKRIFSLRATRSGHLILQEAITNDLIVTDNTGEEISRDKGAQQAIFEQTVARNPHFTGEQDNILWFCGTSSIAEYNLQDMSFKEYKYFLPRNGPGKESLALRGVTRSNGKSILIFFIVDNQPALSYYSDDTQEPDVYFVDDVLPNFQNLVDLEPSADGEVVFCGGNTPASKETKQTTAIIAALKFNRNLQLIDELKLIKKDATVVFCIKRSLKDQNIIFAGCHKSIQVIQWTNNRFNLLVVLADLHSSVISDMCIYGNKIYTVGRKDKFISILRYNFEV